MGASSNKGGMGGPNTRAPGGGGMNYDGNPVGGGMGAQFNFGGPGNNSQGRSLAGNIGGMLGNKFGNFMEKARPGAGAPINNLINNVFNNRPQPGQPLPPGVSKGFGLPPPQQPSRDEMGGFGVPDQNDSQDVNDPNSAFYDSSRGSGREPQFQGMPDEMYNQMKSDEARDAADPFGARTAEYPDYLQWQNDNPNGIQAPAPAPVNRFQPRGMIPPAGGRIGNPRQVNPGQGPMQPGRPGGVDPGFAYPMPSPGGGGKGGMPGPGGPRIGMPVQRPGAPRNIVNQFTRQRTRPR